MALGAGVDEMVLTIEKAYLPTLVRWKIFDPYFGPTGAVSNAAVDHTNTT
jgi:hypothetical protein